MNLPKLIIHIIDWFYPLFRRFMPEQTFRYAACGGANMLLSFLVYFVVYWYILHGQNLELGFTAFKPHVASLLVSFIVSFTVGFLLMKYVVFVDSNLKGRIQLFRYFMSFTFNLFMNYLLLKLFVEKLYINAMVAQIITTTILVIGSYLTQKHFSFRTKIQPGAIEDTDDIAVR